MNPFVNTSRDLRQPEVGGDLFISRFSPNQTDPSILEAISIGCEPLLNNLLEKISESATSLSTHHVLLYGPKGIGKSHLLTRLRHRIHTDETLKESVCVAWIHEDETIASMPQFLVKIYRSLKKTYPQEYSREWLDGLLSQSPAEVEEVLVRRLISRFAKRKMVLLVENLDSLFGNLGVDGQRRLRTLLQEHPFACLIATSQRLFAAVAERSEPFFGFFQPVPLHPLSLDEVGQLMVRIAHLKGERELVEFLGTPEGRGRVRALQGVLRGNPREFIVLSSFATREWLDRLGSCIQRLADELTPYYQDRLRLLSPLQRQIVELLCCEAGTLNPKTISRRLLTEQGSVGKQLRLLEEMGYVTRTQRGREAFYELCEPLLRLACEVKDQSRLGPWIEFLQIWYLPEVAHARREARDRPGIPRCERGQPCESGRNQESPAFVEQAIDASPTDSPTRFERLEALWTMRRWKEGFDAIRDGLVAGGGDYLGDCAEMFSLIFQLSEDPDSLRERVSTLVDIYQQATTDWASHRPRSRIQPWRHGIAAQETAMQTAKPASRSVESAAWPEVQTTLNPLSHLANGLVRSLGRIDVARATRESLESYVAAVERRVADMPEFAVGLRLFRPGVGLLTSGSEGEIVTLIEPERKILRQALGLTDGVAALSAE